MTPTRRPTAALLATMLATTIVAAPAQAHRPGSGGGTTEPSAGRPAFPTAGTLSRFLDPPALVREDLAQTPGGIPLASSSGQVAQDSLKLQMEHLAQAGSPASTLQMFGGRPYVRPAWPTR